MADTGTLSLRHGEAKVAEATIRTQFAPFDPSLPGLYVGQNEGETITDDCPGAAPHRFTGGTIQQIVIDVTGEPFIDLEREAARMLRRE
jgi:hypothetical protein